MATSLTLKQILNSVLSQSAHIQKNAFMSSNDVDDQQMVYIANRVRDEILNYHPWGQLRDDSFSILIQEGKTRYALPADFHTLVPDSIRQGGTSKAVELNIPDGRWFSYKFGTQPDGTMYRARFYGNEIEFADVAAGDTINMEYISSHTVRDDLGPTKEEFNSDTDTYILSDQLLMLGIQAAWAETKMMPQAQQWRANYERKRMEEVGRYVGGQTIGTGKHREVIGASPYYPLWR